MEWESAGVGVSCWRVSAEAAVATATAAAAAAAAAARQVAGVHTPSNGSGSGSGSGSGGIKQRPRGGSRRGGPEKDAPRVQQSEDERLHEMRARRGRRWTARFFGGESPS